MADNAVYILLVSLPLEIRYNLGKFLEWPIPSSSHKVSKHGHIISGMSYGQSADGTVFGLADL